MSEELSLESISAVRADQMFHEMEADVQRETSRMFIWLMLGQWAFAIAVAALWSPYGWAGKARSINIHLPVAVVLGGILISLPVFLCKVRPTAVLTRHVVAVAQMLWSALLIHLTGGRIETHFHVFGSLAFLVFYRDWTILIPATLVVATDHLLRGVFWPESVYGIVNPEWWRFLEHAFWVAFEDVVLVLSCARGIRELRRIAQRQAEAEMLSQSERERVIELQHALAAVSAG